jgi:hypothetical protein
MDRDSVPFVHPGGHAGARDVRGLGARSRCADQAASGAAAGSARAEGARRATAATSDGQGRREFHPFLCFPSSPRLLSRGAFARLMPLFSDSHVRVCSTRSWRWSLAGCSSWRCWCSASRAVRSGSSPCARTPRGVCVPFSLSLLLLSVAFAWRRETELDL